MHASCPLFSFTHAWPYAQTVIALDLYLAYLRGAFNTCYYCAVVTDHLEELQRKCIKHIRKPMSKMLLQEVQAAEAQKAENDVKVEESAEAAPKEKESSAKDKENRDWKRNGTLFARLIRCLHRSFNFQMSDGWSGLIPSLRCLLTVTASILEITAARAMRSTFPAHPCL